MIICPMIYSNISLYCHSNGGICPSVKYASILYLLMSEGLGLSSGESEGNGCRLRCIEVGGLISHGSLIIAAINGLAEQLINSRHF